MMMTTATTRYTKAMTNTDETRKLSVCKRVRFESTEAADDGARMRVCVCVYIANGYLSA